ncbi:MAG: ABC transporter substrate-binding protein [Terracidiphilus sp.]
MRTARALAQVFVGSLVLLFALLPIFAQRPESQIQWEQYTTRNGLPSNRVLCVAANGNRVWAGTDNGLVLIDGRDITKVFSVKDGLVGEIVTALAVDPDTDDLWIGTYSGVSHYSAGTFQNYTTLTSGLANDIVYDIAVQRGVVWAATAAGLSRLDIHSGSWATFDNRNSPMVDPWPVAMSMGDGRAYIATWGTGVLEYDIAKDRWTSHERGGSERREQVTRTSQSTLDFTTGVAYDIDSGVLWTATHRGLIQQDGNAWRLYTSAGSGLASDFINALHLKDNKLWLCTKQGLSVFNLKTSTWTSYSGFSASQHGAATLDKSSKGAGNRLASRGPLDTNVLDVAIDGTDIWVASDKGLSVGTSERARYIDKFNHGTGIPERAIGVPRYPMPESPSERSVYSPKQPTVNIGFFGPLENGPEVPDGVAMLHGAQLAIEEANNRGGYSDQVHSTHLMYELKTHDDSAPWGTSTTEPVKMIMDEHVVAILGSIDGSATHTMLRVATELGVPVVNTATTDSSILDTGTPWLVHLLPDDQQQNHVLARYIAGQKRARRIGVLREDARYARIGAESFMNEIEHIGKMSATEATFQSRDSDFSGQLRELQNAGIDGLLIWCRPREGALILKQMRAAGMRIPTFGPSYLASPELIELAGTAAEGFVASSVLNPTRTDKPWLDFQRSYRDRFGQYPDAYASYAYDGVELLISAIQNAGPDRERVMDALRQLRSDTHEGTAGRMHIDSRLNNAAPPVLARVEGGRFVYWTPNDGR